MGGKNRSNKFPRKARRSLVAVLSGERSSENMAAELRRYGVQVTRGVEDLLDRLPSLLEAPDERLVHALDDAPLYVVEAVVSALARREMVSSLAMLGARLPGRDQRKVVTRALRALESRGVLVVPVKKKVRPSPVLAPRDEVEARMSLRDSDGTSVITIFLSSSSGSMLLFAALEESGCLLDVEVFMDGARKARRELNAVMKKAVNSPATIQVPPAYALYLVEEATGKSRARGDRVPPDLFEFFRELEEECHIIPDESALRDLHPAEPLTFYTEQARDVEALFDSRDVLSVLPSSEMIESFLDKLVDAEESTIIVSKEVEKERLEKAISAGLRAALTGPRRRLMARHIEHFAASLETRQPELAPIAWGSAAALRRDDIDAADIPFVKKLFITHAQLIMDQELHSELEDDANELDATGGADQPRIILP